MVSIVWWTRQALVWPDSRDSSLGGRRILGLWFQNCHRSQPGLLFLVQTSITGLFALLGEGAQGGRGLGEVKGIG